MPLRLEIQFNIVFYSIISGMLIGFLFDSFRNIRGSNIPSIIIFIEDILFGILGALTVFVFLLYTNFAFLGAYVYLFILISCIIYFKFISQHVIFVQQKIGVAILKFSRIVIKNILYPFLIMMSKVIKKNK